MSSNRFASPWLFFVAGGIVALLVFVLGGASFWMFDRVQEQMAAENAADAGDMALFDEAWGIIRQDFFGDMPSPTARTYGAIRGSFEALDDPYTYFIEPEPAVREQEQLQGHFGGVGAYLEVQEDGRVHLTPMIDRPAALAGIQQHDILIAIDGEPVPVPADLDDVTDRVRGPIGTVVRLTVLRGEQQLDFEVERQQIELPSVSYEVLEQASGVGYIRIERFSGLTGKELAEALDELAAASATDSIILDLRGNPGGLLDAAIEVSGHFLDGGVVASERQADGTEKVYNAAAGTGLAGASVVILVNGGTASASEIVAGALRDRGVGILLGESTYGKGSVQRIHRLSDDSAVHVTFARWYTPNGSQIDRLGLAPDIPFTPDPNAPTEDLDPFLQAALDYLR